MSEISVAELAPDVGGEQQSQERVQPLLAKYCFDCHGNDVSEGDLTLECSSRQAKSLPEQEKRWRNFLPTFCWIYRLRWSIEDLSSEVTSNSKENMEANNGWTRKDVWLGLFFLVMGGLIVTYAILAMRNGFSIVFWGLCWVLGPIFIILGGNAVIRSLRARTPEEPPDGPQQTDRDSRGR